MTGRGAPAAAVGHQLAHARPLAARGPRPGQRDRSKVKGRRRAAAGDEVAPRRRAAAGAGEHVLAHGAGGGAVEGVEQLPEGYGGRALGARCARRPGVGDHQRLGGRGDRVEQQLAVLASAGRARRCAGAGPARRRRRPSRAREDTVVEPDQADHAVRHRAHRHHRADGQGAGAEVGAGRAAARAAAGAARGRRPGGAGCPCRPRRRRSAPARGRTARPATRRRAGSTVSWCTPSREHAGPVGDGARASAPVRKRVQPVDELGEPAGQLEVAVAARRRRAARRRPGGGRARTWPPPAAPGRCRPPRCSGAEAAEPEVAPVLGVVPPPDAGLADPPGDALQRVVAEAEPARTGSAPARSRTWVAVSRPRTSSTSCAATPSSGLVAASERSASRTRSWWAGCPRPRRRCRPARTRPRSAARRPRCRGTSPGCRAARGSGRRRAARPAPRAARRPGGPTRGRRGPAPSRRAARRRARSRRRARRWPGGRPAASRAACSGAVGAGRRVAALGTSPSVRRSSRESRPSEPSSGCPTRSAESSTARGTGPSTAAAAERVPERR